MTNKKNFRINKKTALYILSIAGLLVFSSISAVAQQMDTTKEDPTDFMRSNGKLFVVIAVVLVILVGLFTYLISLDRKITKLEKMDKK